MLSNKYARKLRVFFMIAESFLVVYHLEIFRRDSRRKLVFGNGEPRLFLDMVCYNRYI